MSDLDRGALGRWLKDTLPSVRDVTRIAKFEGGQSNPTYRIEAGDSSYVLRRKPFGALLPSAHAIEREFLLLTTMHPTGFPVPAPLALCEDASVIGAPFYIMELVDGRNFPNGTLPTADRSERRPIYEAMVDTLADLHAFEPHDLGLSNFGRSENYLERQIARWTRQYRATQTAEIVEMERLIAWLPLSIPEQAGSALIHGDYRIDNLIYCHGSPRVATVIDWELATLGDPLADFSFFAMSWIMAVDGRSGLAGIDLAELGIPSLADIAERYRARAGRATLPDLAWYFAFNLFRFAAILQGVKKRAENGNASSRDTAQLVERIEPLSMLAWDQAQHAGA